MQTAASATPYSDYRELANIRRDFAFVILRLRNRIVSQCSVEPTSAYSHFPWRERNEISSYLADSIWSCDKLAKLLSECQSLVDFLAVLSKPNILGRQPQTA